MTFNLYAPGNTTCTGAAIFTSTVALSLNGPQTGGTAQSANFTPSTTGTYRWVATYNGDVNNAPVSGAVQRGDRDAHRHPGAAADHDARVAGHHARCRAAVRSGDGQRPS